MKATCDWCNSFVEAPNHYNPLQHSIFCNIHCAQKDYLFRRWQNDKFLTWLAEERRNETKK